MKQSFSKVKKEGSVAAYCLMLNILLLTVTTFSRSSIRKKCADSKNLMFFLTKSYLNFYPFFLFCFVLFFSTVVSLLFIAFLKSSNMLPPHHSGIKLYFIAHTIKLVDDVIWNVCYSKNKRILINSFMTQVFIF